MGRQLATIGIGTNLGDRLHNIKHAMGGLAELGLISRTSLLYETPPAYITDQPPFLNAALQLETELSPQDLLAAIERIMTDMGRVREVRYGPRIIDLDILFYGYVDAASATRTNAGSTGTGSTAAGSAGASSTAAGSTGNIHSRHQQAASVQINQPDLVIPHPLVAERAFVLGPLHDMVPELVHPTLNKSIKCLWHQLDEADKQGIIPVTPVGDSLWQWGKKTYVMGILNVTPDSFSGDGLAQENRASSVQGIAASAEQAPEQAAEQAAERAVTQAIRFADEGADCLDIGGQSTQPGHELVEVEEEITMVTAAVKAVRQRVDLPISVDTFRWEVAEAALDAGAHILNDIWGLGFSKRIAMLAADAGVPLILMHNRMATGYVDQLEIPSGPAYEYDDIGADVCREVNERLELAHQLGVLRWNLISDPGIGFGKTQEQQLNLINRLDELRSLGYPLLFGASRKGFIGKILGGLPPTERVEGTLAANVVAIARGADIIRVHDVKQAVRAAQIADVIVR